MSVKLLTSGNGTPLMAYGEKFFASTTGAPETVKSSVQTEKVQGNSVKIPGKSRRFGKSRELRMLRLDHFQRFPTKSSNNNRANRSSQHRT